MRLVSYFWVLSFCKKWLVAAFSLPLQELPLSAPKRGQDTGPRMNPYHSVEEPREVLSNGLFQSGCVAYCNEDSLFPDGISDGRGTQLSGQRSLGNHPYPSMHTHTLKLYGIAFLAVSQSPLLFLLDSLLTVKLGTSAGELSLPFPSDFKSLPAAKLTFHVKYI